MQTAFISHADCVLHDMGSDHPESPARLKAILSRLTHSNILSQLDNVEAQLVDKAHLLRVHPARYIDQLEMLQPKQGRVYADPDTALMVHTLRAAHLASGAAVQAVDLVLTNQVKNAFCSTRPPGHHAEKNTTMGFCFFNNIAVAASYAMAFHNIERIAIVDFDVHQCNGTIDIFHDDPRVLVCSSFQHPYYPFSHHSIDRDHIINSPLDAGSSGLEFRKKVEKDWLNALQQHKPQLILISAGFDAHKNDPMGDLNLDATDYAWVTSMVNEVANQYAGGRIISILEGGYQLTALAESVEAHIKVLAGLD
jgi:acetoin utilization deacetylase AcuC-like enzyme